MNNIKNITITISTTNSITSLWKTKTRRLNHIKYIIITNTVTQTIPS